LPSNMVMPGITGLLNYIHFICCAINLPSRPQGRAHLSRARGEGFTSEGRGARPATAAYGGPYRGFRARDADGLALGAALKLTMQKTTWAVAAPELVRKPWTVGAAAEDGVAALELARQPSTVGGGEEDGPGSP
jgi:hypothetical protein